MDTFDRKKMLEELYQEKKKLKKLLEKNTIKIEDLSEKPTESQIAKLLEQKENQANASKYKYTNKISEKWRRKAC